MHRTSVVGVLAAALTTGLLLSGCAGPAAPSAATPSPAAALRPHDAADVTFAQQMVPHHQQAVAMAALAADHSGNEQVKRLAARIQQAQDPEIDRMQGFLAAWGAPAAGGMGSMPGMATAPSGEMAAMPGMMSGADLARLGQARGTAFDRLFLQLMTAHHQGAITMATTELTSGDDPDAKALAQAVVTAQQGEIAEMAKLLAAL